MADGILMVTSQHLVLGLLDVQETIFQLVPFVSSYVSPMTHKGDKAAHSALQLWTRVDTAQL